MNARVLTVIVARLLIAASGIAQTSACPISTACCS